jgi:hypothetical protein
MGIKVEFVFKTLLLNDFLTRFLLLEGLELHFKAGGIESSVEAMIGLLLTILLNESPFELLAKVCIPLKVEQLSDLKPSISRFSALLSKEFNCCLGIETSPQ